MYLPFPVPFLPRRRTRSLHLGAPRVEERGGFSRVSIDFAGWPIWFESADVPLRPVPEAAACLALLPALHHGVRVVADFRCDPVWLDNARQLAPIFAFWFG